jgi:hypothetical protein
MCISTCSRGWYVHIKEVEIFISNSWTGWYVHTNLINKLMRLINTYRPLKRISPLVWIQRRLDSRPQSIMGIERLIPRVASLTVDCRGVNISLTKSIWKLSNDKSVRVRYFVKRNSMLLLYCCDHHYDLCFTISSLPFLNCMGRAVVLAL